MNDENPTFGGQIVENWIHFCMETLVSGLGMFENGRKGTVSKDDCITV